MGPAQMEVAALSLGAHMMYVCDPGVSDRQLVPRNSFICFMHAPEKNVANISVSEKTLAIHVRCKRIRAKIWSILTGEWKSWIESSLLSYQMVFQGTHYCT